MPIIYGRRSGKTKAQLEDYQKAISDMINLSQELAKVEQNIPKYIILKHPDTEIRDEEFLAFLEEHEVAIVDHVMMHKGVMYCLDENNFFNLKEMPVWLDFEESDPLPHWARMIPETFVQPRMPSKTHSYMEMNAYVLIASSKKQSKFKRFINKIFRRRTL